MKRWLLAIILSTSAWPSLALAAPAESWPRGGFPIERQPVPVTGQPNPAGIVPVPYGGEALRGAQYLGPARLGTIGLDVGLQMRDEPGLLRYARVVSDPHSLYYRHFLTPQQLANFFGASPQAHARAIVYFQAHGLAVKWWTQRQMLHVVGPQSNIERAFQTHFGWFRKNGVTFYAPMSAPRLSVPLAVRGVGGMVTYHRLRRNFGLGVPFRPSSQMGPGFLVGNSPFDLAAVFDYTGAYNINASCCKGDGVTMGIIGTGPISNGATGDVPEFLAVYGITGTGSLTQVNVTAVAPGYSTGLQTPPPVTPACSQNPFNPDYTTCNPEDIEAQLDTEQTRSLAPDATVLFYLAYNPNECFMSGSCAAGAGIQALGITESDDEWQQAINDNVADVLSASFGIGELDFAGQSGGLLNSNGTGIEPTIFASLAAEGIAIFVSSGDNGAETCQGDGVTATADVLCVSYPSGDPNVVSVGGTTTPIGSNGRLTGLITTWGVQTQSGAGGGGFSSVFGRPAYEPSGQFCADKGSNRCDSTHRLQPDISLNADLVTGDAVIIDSGPGLGGPLIGSVGGTSGSAQDMAAMWALVLEACKKTVSCSTHTWMGSGSHPYRLGNPAPVLHALSSASKAAAFYDVTYGSNAIPLSTSGGNYSMLDAGFHAGPGYDLATGLGAPFARNLIKAIVGL